MGLRGTFRLAAALVALLLALIALFSVMVLSAEPADALAPKAAPVSSARR